MTRGFQRWLWTLTISNVGVGLWADTQPPGVAPERAAATIAAVRSPAPVELSPTRAVFGGPASTNSITGQSPSERFKQFIASPPPIESLVAWPPASGAVIDTPSGSRDITTATPTLQGSAARTNQASAFEQFKAFIASPPVIETLIFRERLSPDLAKPRPYDGSFAKSTNFALFRAAWQKDALLLVQTANENARPELRPDLRFILIYGREHWLLEPGRYIETCTAPFGSFTNPVTISIAFNVANLNQLLQGGLMHIRPGQITWAGNRFLAKEVLTPYRLKFRVQGELLQSNGRPSEMLVSYSTGNASTDINSRWRIRYFYERDVGAAFFPSRVKAYWLRGGEEIEMADFEILRLQLTENPLPRSLFDPVPLLAEYHLPVRLFTDGAMYQVVSYEWDYWAPDPAQPTCTT